MYQFIAVRSGQLRPPPATFVKDTEKYLKNFVIVNAFFFVGLWTVKVAFLLFFRRIYENVMERKFWWWFVLALTVVTMLLGIGDMQYRCVVSPLGKMPHYCKTKAASHYQMIPRVLNCTLDVLTDYMSAVFLLLYTHAIRPGL